jgi:hypothetical protein
MGRLSAAKNSNSRPTELSQLKEELRRASEKLECPESKPAEALEQQTRHHRDPVGNRELATDIRPVPSPRGAKREA